MAFKGEFKLLKDIAPGTPIELPDMGQYNSYFEGAKVGILEHAFRHYQPGQRTPVFMVETSRGPRYTSSGNLDESAQLKVLTGTTRDKLQESKKAAFLSGKLHPYASGILNGCDPEVFVLHKDGSLFPAFEFLSSKEGMVGWDGFQAEIRPEPQGCLMQLGTGIQKCLRDLLASARRKDPGARLSLASVVDVPQPLRDKATDAQVALNCAPSENAYGLHSTPVGDPRTMPLRFAAGHIHSGLALSHKPVEFVPVLDAVFGVACVSLAEGMDSPERRRFYGLPGEYRLPQAVAGNDRVEYRVPSNFWLRHPAIYHLTFELYRATLRFAMNNLGSCWQADRNEVIGTIINCDVPEARKILQRNDKVLRALLNSISNFGQNSKIVGKAHETIMTGVQQICSDDMEKNWHLGDNKWPYVNDHYWAVFAPALK